MPSRRQIMSTQSRNLIARISPKRCIQWTASLVVLSLAAGLLADNRMGPGASTEPQMREASGSRQSGRHDDRAARNRADDADAEARIAEGRRIFRFDTFGDEQNWT